jgi:hypothetical protein
MFPVKATSDGQPANEIRDAANNMDPRQQLTVAPDAQLVVPIGLGVANPANLSLEISPVSGVYDAVSFSTSPQNAEN